MLFSSLIITAATCISGCADIGNGLTAEELKSKSEAILSEASVVYNYSEYGLSYEQSDSLIKQALLSYGERNGLFSDVEASYLRNVIESEDGYICYPSIESICIKDGFLEEKAQLKSDLAFFDGVTKSADPSELYFNGSSSDVSREHTISSASLGPGMSFGKYDGPTGGEEKINFPIRECDETNITFSQSGVVNDHPFFGLILNPEACIKIYNVLSAWFNKQAMYISSGIKGPAGIIYEAWKKLSEAGTVSSATAAFVSSTIGAFSGIFATISSVLSSYPVVGSIIAVIFVITAIAVISVLTAAFILGSLGKGYAIGWEICNIFDWRWVNQELK